MKFKALSGQRTAGEELSPKPKEGKGVSKPSKVLVGGEGGGVSAERSAGRVHCGAGGRAEQSGAGSVRPSRMGVAPGQARHRSGHGGGGGSPGHQDDGGRRTGQCADRVDLSVFPDTDDFARPVVRA